MKEIEFKKKFDPMAVEFINLYDDWQYNMDCTGFEIYKQIKKMHLLLGRMRRHMEKRMTNGTVKKSR